MNNTFANSLEPIDSYKLVHAILDNLAETRKQIDSLFYLQCIDHIKSHIKKFNKTHSLTNSEFIEPFRLYIYSNFSNFVKINLKEIYRSPNPQLVKNDFCF